MSDLKIDSLLTQAAEILEKRLYPEVPSWEILREKYQLSDEYNRKILSFAKNINSHRRRKSLKILIIVAALISILVAFALCMGAKEKRMFYMNTLNVARRDGSLVYTKIEGNEDNVSGVGVEQYRELYVPEGYELDGEYAGVSGELMYKNGDKFYVCIIEPMCSSYAVDTEYHALNQIQINDSIIYFFEDKENNYIFMVGQLPNGSISIRGNITIEDGIRIIESMSC